MTCQHCCSFCNMTSVQVECVANMAVHFRAMYYFYTRFRTCLRKHARQAIDEVLGQTQRLAWMCIFVTFEKLMLKFSCIIAGTVP
jgi:hypothetical protein